MAVAAVLAVGTAACTGDDERPAAPPTSLGQAAVIALLADRTLVGIEPASGKIVVRRSLGAATPIAASGRFLAGSADGRRLFALTPAAPDIPQEVTIFDSRSLRPLNRIPLERGILFRVIAPGPSSGRLYLFGNRPADRRGAEDAVAAVLDVDQGRVRMWTVREAAGHDWWVFDGAVARDESSLYLSYHGGCSENPKLCTGGADRVDIVGNRLLRCKRPSVPGFGCLVRVHGRVEPLNGGVLAATGGQRLVELSKSGAVTASLLARLPRNHVMEFALDALGERAYAVGQCYYNGGVAVVELASKRTQVLTRDVCGERIGVGADLVAVAEQFGATPLGSPSRIALIDPRTGSVRYVNVPAEATDLVVVPSS